jgi:hypothetical protein
LAKKTQDIDDGEFRLCLSGVGLSPGAGKTLGHFADMLSSSEINDNIIENGQETICVLDLNNSNKPELVNTPTPRGTWEGWPVSDTFEHYGTFKYFYSIGGTTVTAVTATISAIVGAANIQPYA